MNAVQQYYNNEKNNRKVNNYYELSKKHITQVGLKPNIKPTKVIEPSPLSPKYRPHKFNPNKVNPGNFNLKKEMKFWEEYFSKGGRSVTRRMQKQKQNQKQRKTRGYRRRV